MMAQAARDPLFKACMAVSNQDVPFVGDLCIRCHSPEGWLGGRSTPTDGSALTAADREGIHCDFCHRLIKPTQIGVNPYPNDPIYTSDTYPVDQNYLSTLTDIPPTSANGMYIVSSSNTKRGPFSDATPKHQFLYSPFHKDAALCGTCHDVSNPAYSAQLDGTFKLNDFNLRSPSFNPYSMFPVERTYSEWLMSDYNSTGVYAPQFGGNKDTVYTCQDCHLRDVSGVACNKAGTPARDDLPLHDLTGGNTFIPTLISQLYPGEVDTTALNAGALRAQQMLQKAATMELAVNHNAYGYLADIKVTNETGHKLPSGYPEGRRIWINLKAFDSNNNLIYESGAYDFNTATLTHDADAKIYEIKPGVDSVISNATGIPEGPSFHFVLNNKIYSDNRIPPRGFTNANFQAIQSPPIGYIYPDGQYWDNTQYQLPVNTATVEATLYYQTLSKEYVEFLRDADTTVFAGAALYNLWSTNGKSMPVAMNTAVQNAPAINCTEVTNLVATNITDTEATLSWNGVTDGVTYRVRYRNPGSNWIYRPTDQNQIILTGLYPGTSYQWEVLTGCFADLSSKSGWTKTLIFTTTGTTSCTEPGNLISSNVTDQTADLQWDAVTEASSYQIRYRYPGGNWVYKNSSGNQVSITGLYSGTYYTWQAISKCSSSLYSDLSNTASFTTTGTATCSSPTNLRAANVTDQSADLQWDAVTGAISYQVRYRYPGSNWIYANTTGPQLSLSGLFSGTTYRWEVITKCSSGLSSNLTTAAPFTTTGTTACPTPLNLRSSNITYQSAQVAWDAVASASSYQLRYRETGLTWTYQNTSGTQYNLTALRPNTTYVWEVISKCSTLSSDWLSSQSFITTDIPLATKINQSEVKSTFESLQVSDPQIYSSRNIIIIDLGTENNDNSIIQVIGLDGKVWYNKEANVTRTEIEISLFKSPQIFVVRVIGRQKSYSRRVLLYQ